MTEKKKSSKNSDDSPLDYIKINRKHYIEELTQKEYITVTSNLLKSFSMIEDNIGAEINNFFNCLLPESKETDQLKLNMLIASKTKTDNIYLENCLNEILNRPELNHVILTKELSEQLSTIIKEGYKKIKKKYVKSYDQIIEIAKKFLEENGDKDIIKRYKKEKTRHLKTISENDLMIFNNSLKKLQRINNEANVKEIKSSKFIPTTKNKNMKNKFDKNENEIFYEFRRYKEDSSFTLPVELLILIRKFNFVKKLKLILNTEMNSEENDIMFNTNNNTTSNTTNNSIDIVLEKSDVQNNIFIFLNLEWLFPNVVEIDVDLSCDSLNDYLINNIYSLNLKNFNKIFHKDIKLNILPTNTNNKRNYDPVQKFSFILANTLLFEEDHSSDKFSSSMLSNNINQGGNIGQMNINANSQTNSNINTSLYVQEGINQKSLDLFFKKYSSFLEMIIIYGYFIQKKMSNLIKAKFTLPMNLCDEISKLIRTQNVIIDNFHFFSFINNQNILHTTIDFNSLDNQTFEKVLNFLNKNQMMNNCNISFFGPEESFKSEMLLKTLQNCDDKYKILKNKKNIYTFNADIEKDIYPNEDIDNYILRKLSKYFEKNLSDFFYLLTIKTCISDLSLFFDMPNILIKNGIYNNILLKFFMNLIIFINNSLNNIKTLLIISENFIFDGRKYPILTDFFDSLQFNDINKDFKLLNLCFQVKIFHISNIHRLLSYNLVYLSIGAFDLISFNSFINFFCSKNFREKSNLAKLKITLNNTVIEIKEVYDSIVKLFNEFPKKMDEISLYTSLIISYKQIKEILNMINYNQLINVFMMFNLKSINKDKKLEEFLESDLNNAENDTCITLENMIDLIRIKKDENISNKIINLMINLKKKNPRFINYNIYTNIEKFLCQNERKNVIIQFKS